MEEALPVFLGPALGYCRGPGFNPGIASMGFFNPILKAHSASMDHKAQSEFFLCIFSSLTCLKKRVFSRPDLLQLKVPARLYWDLLTSRRYQPACHNF